VLEKVSWSAQMIKELNSNSEDTYISKERISGFWFTKLHEVLQKMKIEELFIGGINTDQCVLATLQDAHQLGYKTTLLQDCTATSSPQFCFDAAVYNSKKLGDVAKFEDITFS
jgi:ureidoacrylate peracid hydrolase